jgi:acyl carrier protein
MYSNEQIKQMCIDFLVERENVTHSEAETFRDQPFARWTGMDSLGATEMAMWIEKTFGVKVSDEEMLGMSLSLLIPKIASMQKQQSPARATDTSVVQKSDKGEAVSVPVQAQKDSASVVQKSDKGEDVSVPAKPQRKTSSSTKKTKKGEDVSVSAKPQRKTSSGAKKTKKDAGDSMPVQSQKDSVVDVQPVDNTKADCLAVCKLLGDVCNAQLKGRPNYQARNYCEFVNCLLYENFQKLR